MCAHGKECDWMAGRLHTLHVLALCSCSGADGLFDEHAQTAMGTSGATGMPSDSVASAVARLCRTSAASAGTRIVRAAVEGGARASETFASREGVANGEADPVYLASIEVAAAAERFVQSLDATTQSADSALWEALHGAAAVTADATRTFTGAHQMWAETRDAARRALVQCMPSVAMPSGNTRTAASGAMPCGAAGTTSVARLADVVRPAFVAQQPFDSWYAAATHFVGLVAGTQAPFANPSSSAATTRSTQSAGSAGRAGSAFESVESMVPCCMRASTHCCCCWTSCAVVVSVSVAAVLVATAVAGGIVPLQ